MKLTKFDIGAEIISILTKGMYQDPRDALREYIQNAVDANSKDVKVKIRQNTIVVEDDGIGMDIQTLRKALRVGVSDKKPGVDVGFMGIGIYSAFHLCSNLTIYSKAQSSKPCWLKMDFQGMKTTLSNQKELRHENKVTGDELIDLQTLLEKYISLSNENELSEDEFPFVGTRVELSGVEGNFYKELTSFEFVADYLKDVVPLPFDHTRFHWGEEIEKKIDEICTNHNAKFELVNVELQVNNRVESLFKPYIDEDFHDSKCQPPIFEEVKRDGTFIGVVWGCLNSTRNKIREREKRGFLIRKQGFAIGRRENVIKYFGSSTHFDRYIGEVIVVNPSLLPNASRDDFEFTRLRTILYDSLANVGSIFNQRSNDFQNSTKALEKIDQVTEDVKQINVNFSEYEKNPEKLVNYIVSLSGFENDIASILNRGVFKSDKAKEDSAKKLSHSICELKDAVQMTINRLTEEKKNSKQSKNPTNEKVKIAKELSKIKTGAPKIHLINYSNLLELLKDLDIDLNQNIAEIFNLIDEQFIQRLAENQLEYQAILEKLKEDIQDLDD